MRGKSTGSYTPYRPLLWGTGDIYICRIVPYENSIHFEWLDIGAEKYDIYFRVRGSEEFIYSGNTASNTFDIPDLSSDTDYEFYVCAGTAKSRIRLARCGESVGTVVQYLHPDDEAYAFSGRYLCSPSLVKHPDGYLLASMNLYAGSAPQNLTLIFRSDDNGET